MLESTVSPADIADRLRSHGIKPTQQRVEIAAVLFAKPQHLSADQVLEQLNRRDAYASKATVYNTLSLFTRKRLIREVIVDPVKVFYDSTTSPHHHLYNIDTGALVDLDPVNVDLGSLPVPPAGTEIDGVDVIVRVRSISSAGGR
jgi:Fur family iron response transcriptional regulator